MDASGGAVTVSTRLSHSWLLLFWGGQPGVDWCKGECLYGPDVALAAALGNAVRLEASQTAPRVPCSRCSRAGVWCCVRVALTCHVHLGLCWSWHVLGLSWCSPVSWLAALCPLAALLNSGSGICCGWPSSLHPPLDECSLGCPPAPEPGVPCWGRGPIRLHTHTHTQPMAHSQHS